MGESADWENAPTDQTTVDGDRWYDEMDVLARSLGFIGAHDHAFRFSVPPEYRRARANRPRSKPLFEEDEEEDAFLDDEEFHEADSTSESKGGVAAFAEETAAANDNSRA